MFASNNVKNRLNLIGSIVLTIVSVFYTFERINYLSDLNKQHLETVISSNYLALQKNNYRELIENSNLNNDYYVSIKNNNTQINNIDMPKFPVCFNKRLNINGNIVDLESCKQFNISNIFIIIFSLLIAVVMVINIYLRKNNFNNYLVLKKLIFGDDINFKTKSNDVDSLVDELISNEKNVLNYKNQKNEFEEKAKLYKIATQVAHDIKSPLVSLKTAIENNNKELSALAIDQISSIADNLLEKNKNVIISSSVIEKTVELNNLINKVLELKRIEKNDININFNKSEDIYINVNESELMRVVSNLLNNAYEYSNKKEIEVMITHDNLMAQIVISDNGKGFSEEQLVEFRKSQKIYKPNGNGIGLHSTYEFLQTLGGNITLSNKPDQNGAIVCISLPILEYAENQIQKKSSSPKKQIVLIDDNILIGKAWALSAKDKIKVSFYKSVSEFKKQIEKYDLNTPIYIDSDLGEAVSGDQASKEFYSYGFSNISLVTGYDKGAFPDKMPWIKEIRGKEFPSELLA